jgi:hypothetical protein
VGDARHGCESQSDSGRCDEPAVLSRQTHPKTFYESGIGKPRNMGTAQDYFSHLPGKNMPEGVSCGRALP